MPTTIPVRVDSQSGIVYIPEMTGPSDPILNALAAYTRWPVHRTPSAYRLRFTSDDYKQKRLTGLGFSKTNACPFLDSDEFDQVPLLFEYVYPDPRDPAVITEVHYYTLNRRFHREGGPARYQISPTRGQSVLMEWFQHGLRHRADGPARINYAGIELKSLHDEYGSELIGPYQMLVEVADFGWFRDGERATFPYPGKARLNQVSVLFNEDHQFHDHGTEFAFQAATSTWEWRDHGAPRHGLIPVRLVVDAYRDSYQDGQWRTRTGTIGESTWYRGDELLDAPKEFPPVELIDQFGFFDRPFYPEAAVEVRLETALSALT